jgi:phage shock protein PspC (stress-responsive transcriptional regulator)
MAGVLRARHHGDDMSTETPQQTPRLTRSTTDQVIAGVAGGLARRLGVGSGWIRVGFVVLAFFGGLGILAYLVAWLAIPEEGASKAIFEDWIGDLDGAGAWIGFGLIVLAAVALLSSTDLIAGELILAGALLLAGLLLFRRDSDRRGDPAPLEPADAEPEADVPPTSASVTSPPPAAAAVIEDDEDTRPSSQSAPPPAPPAEPKPPRERSMLGRLIMACLLVAVGVVALLDNVEVLDPDVGDYFAIVLGIIGAGLLVGSVVGRARGFIVLGVVLVPLVLIAASADLSIGGEWGDRRYEPMTAAEIPASYDHGIGVLRIDLRDLDPAELPLDDPIVAELGIGELEVVVPDGIDVRVATDLGIGGLSLFDENSGGIGIDVNIDRLAGDGEIDVDLDLDVGIGHILVRAAP